MKEIYNIGDKLIPSLLGFPKQAGDSTARYAANKNIETVAAGKRVHGSFGATSFTQTFMVYENYALGNPSAFYPLTDYGWGVGIKKYDIWLPPEQFHLQAVMVRILSMGYYEDGGSPLVHPPTFTADVEFCQSDVSRTTGITRFCRSQVAGGVGADAGWSAKGADYAFLFSNSTTACQINSSTWAYSQYKGLVGDHQRGWMFNGAPVEVGGNVHDRFVLTLTLANDGNPNNRRFEATLDVTFTGFLY